MRRLPRILLNAATAVSLVLCVATVGLWARSYTAGIALRPTRGVLITISLGGIAGAWAAPGGDLGVSDWRGYRSFKPFDNAPDAAAAEFAVHLPGLSCVSVLYAGAKKFSEVYVRCWLMAGLLSVLPCRALIGRVRGRRARCAAVCPACGYDLRATPDRCPECGMIPAQ